MPTRLVALDEGPDIPLDRTMVVVGRHPQCDARLDSLRVSRHHCCMTQENGEVLVRDLGSTNGIRINGQRVELGRLRPGDELSIAHIRYRLDTSANGQDMTLADVGTHQIRLPAAADSPSPLADLVAAGGGGVAVGVESKQGLAARAARPELKDSALAAVLRNAIPASMAEKYQIHVIVKGPHAEENGERREECPPDSSR